MNGITATELEFLGCFGVEPQLLDADTPWSGNDAVYLAEVNGLSVSFAIQPAYQDVRLIVRRGDRRLFEFNAVGVADVRVHDERNQDVVEVILTERSWMRIQLRPTFAITQGFGLKAD